MHGVVDSCSSQLGVAIMEGSMIERVCQILGKRFWFVGTNGNPADLICRVIYLVRVKRMI